MQTFIQHLLSKTTLDSNRVIECVDSLCEGNTNDVMRIMAYLSSYSNIPEVPETSAVRDSATLVSYDFFKNNVRFKYIGSREFKVKEEQKDLDGQTYDDWYDIPSEVRNSSGDFKITVKYWANDTCSLERWLNKQ